MGRCRHATADLVGSFSDRLWCPQCRDYVSLGPATETDATRIERRAAELVVTAPHDARGFSMRTPYERCGLAECGCVDDVAVTEVERAQHLAGWLARVIAGHGEEQGNG